MPVPAQQTRSPCRRSGHRRQIRLNVEACKFRMCQFFWWGSPCTGQSTGGGPYLFFRSPEPLPGEPILRPLAGLYKTRNSHLAGNTIRLASVIRRERPDRIVSFMESANCPTIVAAAVTGFLDRLSVSVRCNPATIPWLNRLLIPIAYRLADRVVAPSDGVRNALRKMGLPPRKLLVVPNPLARRTDATTSTRSESPLRYILGVGRLEREKGFDRLLKAFSEVDRSDVDLVILGDGTERSTLRAISQELGIASHLHLPGMVSDVDAWYRRADCFVLTSHYEGSPNVVAEAMANGCQVVSFDCPYGPAELLEGGYSGILVPQDNIEGLSDAMQQLVSDRALRERLSKVGRQRAEAFSVEKIAPRWLN